MHRHKRTTSVVVFLLAALAMLAGACGSSTTSAGDASEREATFVVVGPTATMTGVIGSSTPGLVKALIADNPDVTTVVLVDVPGSIDDVANIEAARLLREAGLATHVPSHGVVASGGVDFFLAGATRTYEAGARFGVHSWATGDGTSGADIERGDPAHSLYLDYYADVGIEAEFYWFTLAAAPADSIHFMTAPELTQYDFGNVVTSDTAAADATEVSDLYLETGNVAGDVVVVVAQGGPVTELFAPDRDVAEILNTLDLNAVHLVTVHQVQTLNPDTFTAEDVSFERAEQETVVTIDNLSAVVNSFTSRGKQVYVVGISYGAFVVQEFLAAHGNVAAGYLIEVGRIDMPAEVWTEFAEGRAAGFVDGTEVVTFTIDEAGMGAGTAAGDRNMARLAAALGQHRYSERLANTDLSNVVYVYGTSDEQVGRLTAAEVDFLRGQGADVIEYEGGHDTPDAVTADALARLVPTSYITS